MTWFHAIQLALLVGVLFIIVERVRTLSFRAGLDLRVFRRAVMQALRAGRHDIAVELVQRAKPAWVAEALWPLLDPDSSEVDKRIDLEDGLMELEARAVSRLRAVRVSASMGSLLGFIGAAIEIDWVFNGEHGLLSLEAGLVQNIGLGRAVLSIGIGIATSALALGSWIALKEVAKGLIVDSRRAVASVESFLRPLHKPEDEEE